MKSDEVDTGHGFGDRVLDLQTSIHFQECDRSVVADKELDGSRTPIVHMASEARRSVVQRCTNVVGQADRRGFLDHFLITALHRTIAFTEVQHLAFAVAHDGLAHSAAAATCERATEESRPKSIASAESIESVDWW